jgi:membrane-associated phospholipid phosphatase
VWGGALLLGRGRAREAAYRITLAEFVAVGGVVGLKRLFRRPRPYAVLPGIQSRSGTERPGAKRGDPYAFPSGHAALAFALAVSWSLEHPAWYVTGASLVWATSVALSRIWLGVHYPGDVLAGAVLGAAVAAVVHFLGPSITPAFLQDDEAQATAPAFRIRLLRL